MSLLDQIADKEKQRFLKAGLTEVDYRVFIELRSIFPNSFQSANEYIVNVVESRMQKVEVR